MPDVVIIVDDGEFQVLEKVYVWLVFLSRNLEIQESLRSINDQTSGRLSLDGQNSVEIPCHVALDNFYWNVS
jgi:hypothetical protein